MNGLYDLMIHPIYKETMWKCDNTPESLLLAESFVQSNYFSNYSLMFYDIKTDRMLAIANPVSEIINDIPKIVKAISDLEDCFIEYIALCSIAECYLIGMTFRKGRIQFPATYRYDNNKLIKIPLDKSLVL